MPITRNIAGLIIVMLPLLAATAAEPPARNTGFFALYEHNRTAGTPNYITTDLLMLSYWLTLDHAITDYEQSKALPDLTQLVETLAAQKDLSKPNRDFLDILTAILKNQDAPNEDTKAELARIHAAAGIERSTLFLQKIDYTQFKVRGKYTQSEELGRYFVASRFAGAILFPATESQATGITAEDADHLAAQALELMHAIQDNPKAKQLYQNLNSKFDYLFGPPDDLTLAQATGCAKPGIAPADFRKALAALNVQPRILSGIVEIPRLEQGRSPAQVLTGWRFLPQRYTPESAAFQDLVYNRVGNYTGNGTPFTMGVIEGQKVKTFPTALEIMALLGSKPADISLTQSGDREYEGYAASAQKAAAELAKGTGLTGQQIAFLRKLAASSRTPKGLTAALSFWTWRRYENLLYAKQSYTMVGKSMSLVQPRKTAAIEPSPAIFQAIADLARQTSQGIGMGAGPLDKLAAEASHCAKLAGAPAAKLPLTATDMAYLNDLDLKLSQISGGQDHPIVVDVHTDGNSKQVLEEAVGYAAPDKADAGGVPALGARWTHYEFKAPLDGRMTNEDWITALNSGKLPALNVPAAAPAPKK